MGWRKLRLPSARASTAGRPSSEAALAGPDIQVQKGNRMEKKEFVCIGCPLGCNVTVEAEGKEIKSITGNTCPRGADYVTKELIDPRRIVTSLVRVRGGELPVVSVKTAADIPKDKIADCIKVLKDIELHAPVRMGDLVAENVCGSGVNVIATREVNVQE